MKNVKLSFLLITVALLNFGCGKQNTANSNGSSSSSNPSSIGQANYSPTSGNLSWDQFKTQVASGAFAAKISGTEIYNYVGYTMDVNSSSCLWIFTCSSSKTSSTFFTREYGTNYIKHPFCNNGGTCTSTDPIKQQLIQIVGQAQTYGQLSNTKFQVMTYSGYLYVIDLSYPIVANPIARLDNVGSYYELTNVTKF